MRPRLAVLVAAAVLAFALAAGLGTPGVSDDPAVTAPENRDRATVTITDEDGTVLATVDAAVADTPDERYQGLSGTDSLPRGEGMLFVYESAGVRTFVMRDMNYPIDMVFVGANGTITRIYHAEVESDGDLTEYRARAKWVLEVPAGYTDETGVEAGDSVSITYS